MPILVKIAISVADILADPIIGTALETTLNSEKLKPVALAVINLHLPEGISQSFSR